MVLFLQWYFFSSPYVSFSFRQQLWPHYGYYTIQIQSVDTLQQISMSRGWRLMGSACKWMDHPPSSLLLPEVCCCQIGLGPPLSLSLLWSNTALEDYSKIPSKMAKNPNEAF